MTGLFRVFRKANIVTAQCASFSRFHAIKMPKKYLRFLVTQERRYEMAPLYLASYVDLQRPVSLPRKRWNFFQTKVIHQALKDVTQAHPHHTVIEIHQCKGKTKIATHVETLAIEAGKQIKLDVIYLLKLKSLMPAV